MYCCPWGVSRPVPEPRSFRYVVPIRINIQTSFFAKTTNAASRLTTLGNTALDGVPLDVIGVVGLDIGGETVEGALDSFFGGRVHHAGLLIVSMQVPSRAYMHTDVLTGATYVLRRIIWYPADEGNLAPGTLAGVELVLDIEDGVATANALLAPAVLALCAEQLLAESVKVGFLGGLLNDNLLPVVADLVDDPFDVLAKLELVEGADALRCYGDTKVVLVEVPF